MHREQYGEYGYWCQVVFSTWFSFTRLCFRKATSVKKEESSKAKKSRRAISLDSGKEIMSTYCGTWYFSCGRWCGDFIFTGIVISSFFYINIFNFHRINSFINRLERVKIWVWFNFFLWFSLSSKCDRLEFHVNVKTFWILFIMNKMAKYFYVTEFNTRVFWQTLLIDGVGGLDREIFSVRWAWGTVRWCQFF